MVISGHQRGHQRGHQWSSAVRVADGTRGALRVVISGHQWPSVVISAHPLSSVAIRRQSAGNHVPPPLLATSCAKAASLWEKACLMRGAIMWPSVVISGHQWSSVVISGHHQGEGVPLLVPLLPHTAMQLRLRHPLL